MGDFRPSGDHFQVSTIFGTLPLIIPCHGTLTNLGWTLTRGIEPDYEITDPTGSGCISATRITPNEDEGYALDYPLNPTLGDKYSVELICRSNMQSHFYLRFKLRQLDGSIINEAWINTWRGTSSPFHPERLTREWRYYVLPEDLEHEWTKYNIDISKCFSETFKTEDFRLHAFTGLRLCGKIDIAKLNVIYHQ